MFSLREFKLRLYTGEHPLLYRDARQNGPTEINFLYTFLSKEFCEETFSDETGKKYSMKTQFLDRSQRNLIFNRKYDGFIALDNIRMIFSIRPDIWGTICLNCEEEISKAENTRALHDYILELADEDVRDRCFRTYLREKADNDIAAALAAVIIYLVMCGNIDEKMVECFSDTRAINQQFAYMERTCDMLEPAYGSITAADFSWIVRDYYNDYSALLSYVSQVSLRDGVNEDKNVFDIIYSVITDNNKPKAVHISGAAGTGKTIMTQMLYMKLACDVYSGRNTTLAPYYIDINYYVRKYSDNSKLLQERIIEDFAHFASYCADNPQRVPILFVNGIKTYTLNQFDAEYCLNDLIEGLNKRQRGRNKVRTVVAVENGVVKNPARQKKAPVFAVGNYICSVTIDSLYLPNADMAKAYLKKFCKIYDFAFEESIHDKLIRLGIKRIDTCQLRMIIERLWEASDIAELYDTVCMDNLGGSTGEIRNEMYEAAHWAFNFVCTDNACAPLSDSRLVELVSAHESFQDYFIALWYILRIRDDSIKNNINMFEMIMPKGITRFMVPMINRSAADEGRILDLIDQMYVKMGRLAKSEMTYLLGRIKSPGMTERAERLLLEFYHQQNEKIKGCPSHDMEYRRMLFLLRGISVSLIVKGKKDISNEYIDFLIHDNLANEINRGFHLEYYGDKAYLPTYDTLDFRDDITQGKRTLDELIAANGLSMRKRQLPPIFDLNLFTICSLLQVRIESPGKQVMSGMTYYLKKACEHAEWYLKNEPRSNKTFREYLKMCIRDFDNYINGKDAGKNSVGAIAYKTYCSEIERSGWLQRGLRAPENVAEHIYHTYLLGLMFLPDTYPGHDDYSKDHILKLILIHDVAEAVTGDIPKPIKDLNPDYYRKQEDEEMGIFLLRGSYPGFADMPDYYNIWKSWNDKNDINGRIATELDVIQCLFQLLEYVNEYPLNFTDENDLGSWLNSYLSVETDPGQKILKTVIFENYEYHDTLKKFGII